MNRGKLIKKTISFFILITIFTTMMPNFVFATTSENLAGISNWWVDTIPDHSTFTSRGDGVRITQTKQTPYKADGVTKNTATDGNFRLSFNKTTGAASALSTEYYAGNVTLTIKYTVQYVNAASNSSYYYLNIPGYAHIRVYGETVQVLNSLSGSTNTVENGSLKSNSLGTENTLILNIDTVNDKFTATLNGNSTSEATSMGVNLGTGSVGSVGSITIDNMERMTEDSYLDISSVVISDDDSQKIELDDDTQAIVESLPNKLVEDHKNVTTNVSLPWEITGIRWKSTDYSVMNEFGKITRKSESDPNKVEIYGSFEGKTKDGTAITITKTYFFYVTGLDNSLNVTQSVNPSSDSSAEKWYTPPQRNGVEDGYPILGDPMYISDEAFFGKWDSTNKTWILKPFFDYSSYAGLSKVESYAKAGDYTNAKAEIQKYYADNFDKKSTKQTSLSANSIINHNVLYEMISRNAYPTSYEGNNPINYFYINKNKSTVEIDITQRLNEAKGSFESFSTMIASVDKYKSQSTIYSRESSTPPVLIVKLADGSEIECPVKKDSYIQGGTYKDVNYGSATALLVEEAGTYNNFEDRTKRAYIDFDISQLTNSMTIKKAYVKLTAEYNGSDSQRLMLMYWHKDSSWKEDAICFNTFTDYMYFSCNDMVCWDYVTSNKPSIKGKVCGYHRGNELGALSDIYSYYDNIGSGHQAFVEDYEKYAYTCIRQYMGLINSIGVEHDVMNDLDLACHMDTISQDFLRLINSDYMTPEIFTAFLKHIWLLAEHHIYESYGKHDSNWATYSTGGVYSVCARYPEFERHDVWLDATKEENDRAIKGFVYEDGMSYELSQGYTNTMLATFTAPYDIMGLTGEESPYRENTENIIYNLVMSLYKQTAPGLGGFGLGDNTDPYEKQTTMFKRWYDTLFKGDPILAYMSTDGSTGWLPEHATTNYPVGLRTFMRSDWSDDALAMAITNKMEGSHGHKDTLSISMYAYGKFLLVDPGYGGILTGNIRNYMISPQQHNTVTVNDYKNYLDVETNEIDDDIKKAVVTLQDKDGKQICFDSNSQYDFVEYSTDAYTTTDLSQRSVTFLKNQKMWIVTDYIVPLDEDSSNVYTQNWHLNYDSEMTIDQNKVIRSNNSDEPNVMIVPVAPTEINEAYSVKTLFSAKQGQFVDSKKAVLKKTKSGETIYSTIILPMDVGEDYDVTTKKLTTTLGEENKVNAFRFTVTNKNTNEVRKFLYYHLNDANLKTEVKIGSYITDAQTLLVEEYDTGSIKSMYMVNGTYVFKNVYEIFRTTEETSASFIINNKVLDYSVADSDATALENVTFLSTLANTVTYNGEQYDFTVADGKITFTDIVPPEDSLDDVNKGTVIFDSSLNPELLEVTTTTHEYYKVSNMGKDGIKFENIKSVPYKADGNINSDSKVAGIFRFNGIFEDEENGTKTVTNLMAGKYALEFTIQQSINTERIKSDGTKLNTYSSFSFGRADEALENLKDSFVDFRLYNDYMNIIRMADTQKDYLRKDLSHVALQSFESDKEWKLRVVFDTVNKTYSVFVNDKYDPSASNFPYNVTSTSDSDGNVTWTKKAGNYVPDLSITLMDANTISSYIWVKNVKLYEIEKDEDDPRILAVNEMLPIKLFNGDINFVDGNLNIPNSSNVTWTSSDTSIIGNDGVLKKNTSQLIPITFTAIGTFNDTDATGRVFDFTKVYNMTVTTNNWIMTATKNEKVVSASVSCKSGNYDSKPVLIIAGYNSNGAVCDFHVKYVSEKLVNYTYTLNNEAETAKTFLLDDFNNIKPLIPNVVLK